MSQTKLIVFGYSTGTSTVMRNGEPISKPVPETKCIIKDENNQVIAEDSVKLFHKDKKVTNKLKRRKMAFRKTVSQIEDKELRTELWSQFRNNMRQIN